MSTPTIMVGPFNATPDVRGIAEYLCDGIDDQVEIRAAIEYAEAVDGYLILAPGKFETSESLIIRYPKEIRLNNISIRGEQG